MKRFCPWSLMSVALCVSALGLAAAAAANETYADTRIGKEIRRGDDAADTCTRLHFKAAEYDACITNLQKNRPQGVDANAFDTGLYFEAWFNADGQVHPYFTAAAPMGEEVMAAKPLAAKYFKLWRDGQKKAGVSDVQMCETTLLDPTLYQQHVAAAEHGY